MNKTIIQIILFGLATILIFTAGCTTGEKWLKVYPGSSQQTIVETLGRPDGYRTQGEYTILTYANRLISGWSWDRADYFVILKDDKVIEYGPGQIREKNVGGVHTVFLHHY